MAVARPASTSSGVAPQHLLVLVEQRLALGRVEDDGVGLPELHVGGEAGPARADDAEASICSTEILGIISQPCSGHLPAPRPVRRCRVAVRAGFFQSGRLGDGEGAAVRTVPERGAWAKKPGTGVSRARFVWIRSGQSQQLPRDRLEGLHGVRVVVAGVEAVRRVAQAVLVRVVLIRDGLLGARAAWRPYGCSTRRRGRFIDQRSVGKPGYGDTTASWHFLAHVDDGSKWQWQYYARGRQLCLSGELDGQYQCHCCKWLAVCWLDRSRG